MEHYTITSIPRYIISKFIIPLGAAWFIYLTVADKLIVGPIMNGIIMAIAIIVFIQFGILGFKIKIISFDDRHLTVGRKKLSIKDIESVVIPRGQGFIKSILNMSFNMVIRVNGKNYYTAVPIGYCNEINYFRNLLATVGIQFDETL